ncbi:hypothetical protein I317_07883 [Kwoniella heveanensis CBS 569]|uniref:GPI mannosyltransferase 2 n=1 Tax=Kwoniella heveanensis BCC8398 TaxID=1296120 RepID=A0A1B9GJ68_9TREE|nr:hypothetical protein I316_07266 [Kwoniella heveanensis BCC8398]OCF38351.1 hypothetical protein I317_07883 [Kwoniella heveanensis CBS 569]
MTIVRSLADRPTSTVAVLALSIRISHLIVLYLLSLILPPFDASQPIVASSILPGLRWDAVHFSSIALEGYRWEQQLAFQPLWQAILRLSGEGLGSIKGGKAEVSVKDVVRGGMGVSVLAWVGASVMLFKLTSHLFPSSSHRFALLTTLLYLLPPTPVPSLPYTEPTYALFVFTGLYLLIVKKQYILSGACFAGATGLRATGLLNSLILLGVAMLGDDIISRLSLPQLIKRLFTGSWKAVIPCITTVSPFVLFQWYAYESFCGSAAKSEGVEPRPWCASKVPFVYGFVQAEYWNIGLFNYWTSAQLPNILLAGPIFVISYLGSRKFVRNLVSAWFPASRSGTARTNTDTTTRTDFDEVHPALPVLYLHHWLMMALLLVASHTQIALRVCITDPVVWWNIASLAMSPATSTSLKGKSREAPATTKEEETTDKRGTSRSSTPSSKDQTSVEVERVKEKQEEMRWETTRIGRWWITWALVWGAISTVLWVGHYPPA